MNQNIIDEIPPPAHCKISWSDFFYSDESNCIGSLNSISTFSHYNKKSNVDSDEDTINSNIDSNDTNLDQDLKKIFEMSDFDKVVTHEIAGEYGYDSEDSNHSCRLNKVDFYVPTSDAAIQNTKK